jgi:hypothetical protein
MFLVNCVGSWGAWATCQVTCGTGAQSQTYTITVPTVGTGTSCPYANLATQSQACTVVPACVGMLNSFTNTPYFRRRRKLCGLLGRVGRVLLHVWRGRYPNTVVHDYRCGVRGWYSVCSNTGTDRVTSVFVRCGVSGYVLICVTLANRFFTYLIMTIFLQ